MNFNYFSSAWEDIKHTPHWFEKLCILAAVSFIPIFGFIAVAGYLFSWARDIAWKIHQPMPAHVFGNSDGRQYSRGFFVAVICIVFTLIPGIIQGIGNWAFMQSMAGTSFARDLALENMMWGSHNVLLTLVVIALYILAFFFAAVGCMRMSIYGRLYPGFQVQQIWKMIRHEPRGLWQILGMTILVAIVAAVCVFTITMALFALIFAGSFVNTMWSPFDLGMMGSGMMMGIDPYMMPDAASEINPIIAVPAFLVLLGVIFFAQVVDIFIATLLTRALGYWTMQFDVDQWKGQDDLLPFERVNSTNPASASNSVNNQDPVNPNTGTGAN